MKVVALFARQMFLPQVVKTPAHEDGGFPLPYMKEKARALRAGTVRAQGKILWPPSMGCPRHRQEHVGVVLGCNNYR